VHKEGFLTTYIAAVLPYDGRGTSLIARGPCICVSLYTKHKTLALACPFLLICYYVHLLFAAITQSRQSWQLRFQHSHFCCSAILHVFSLQRSRNHVSLGNCVSSIPISAALPYCMSSLCSDHAFTSVLATAFPAFPFLLLCHIASFLFAAITHSHQSFQPLAFPTHSHTCCSAIMRGISL